MLDFDAEFESVEKVAKKLTLKSLNKFFHYFFVATFQRFRSQHQIFRT
jgi:hypothetical protein